MALPTFIGIGVQRTSTKWLHTLLAGHPEICVLPFWSETRFFDFHYERGIEWYETFFWPPSYVEKFPAIGEISTHYYNCELCPRRIAAVLPMIKVIIMLTHPVNRAYAQYTSSVARGSYQGSFESFMMNRPGALEKGFYSRYLKQCYRYFDRSQVLALIAEDVSADVFETKLTLASFLGIAAEKFRASIARDKTNVQNIPAIHSFYGLLARTGRTLRKQRLEPVVDFVKGLGIDAMFEQATSPPPLNVELKRRISRMYQHEFDELEECLQVDLAAWRG